VSQGKKKTEQAKRAARTDRVVHRTIRDGTVRYTGADKSKSNGQRPKKGK
jgi:hypothetical protein